MAAWRRGLGHRRTRPLTAGGSRPGAIGFSLPSRRRRHRHAPPAPARRDRNGHKRPAGRGRCPFPPAIHASSGRTSVLKASTSTPLAAMHVALLLRRLQCLPVDQQRFGRGLLDVHHRADLSRHLVLDVVALVEHEGDARAGPVGAHGHDLVEDAEQLVGVGRPDQKVVVGIKAAVEMEPAQTAEPQQAGDDELDVGPRSVVARVHQHVGLGAEGQAVRQRRAPVRARPWCKSRARRACTQGACRRPRAGRRRSPAAPPPGGPGAPGYRPGPGNWCRRRTTG